MNPLWLLLAGFGMLTLKGSPMMGGGAAPQGPAGPSLFDQNMPPDIGAAVLNCAARCPDPQQMLTIAAELARQNHPIAAIFLQTRAAMLIQARNAQPQLPASPQVAGAAQASTAAPQVPVQAAAVPQAPPPSRNIQVTLTPEQHAKYREFLEFDTRKSEAANGTAPKPEASSIASPVNVKERTA